MTGAGHGGLAGLSSEPGGPYQPQELSQAESQVLGVGGVDMDKRPALDRGTPLFSSVSGTLEMVPASLLSVTAGP